MKRLVYFFVCALMTVSMAAQNLSLSSSFSVSEADLNRIQNGDFVYNIEGVGEFILSGEGGVSYEYSRPSIWGKKRHRLVMNVGQGSISAVSSDPSKKIRINSVSLSGYAYASFDFSQVEINGISVMWYTDGAMTNPYVTSVENLKCWDACPITVKGNKVSVISIQVSYSVYDYINSCTISDKEECVTSPYTYAENITLDRTLSAGWNTLCLPFDCSVSELGEGVVAQQFTAYDPTKGLDFAIVDQMEANKPYMVYCAQEIPAQSITFSAREIYGATPQPVSYNGMTFIGNYEPGFSMYGKYGVAQNKLVKGGVHATVNGTRAYFEYTEPAAASVLRVNYQTAGNTTGIETVQSVAAAVQKGVYNLQGVCVRADNCLQGLPAGIYIVDGRKVTVK